MRLLSRMFHIIIAAQVHVDPPPIPPIKSKINEKPNRDFGKIELRRDSMSENLDLYELKMALYDNGKPEEFLLFIHKFNYQGVRNVEDNWKRFNAFVRWYVEKRCVRLTCCLPR